MLTRTRWDAQTLLTTTPENPDVHRMDFGNPWILFSGLLIGLVGFLMFNHGRKEQNFRVLFTGLALCVYPYFVGSVLMIWLVFAAIVSVLYALNRFA